jgi:hypothetical protein
MPLRLKTGVTIPVAPSLTSELLSGFFKNTTVLPDEQLNATGPFDTRLDVPWFEQRKDLWCWVACAQMVLRFFGVFHKQCEIARRQLHKPCCSSSAPSYCDEDCNAEEVDQAFERAGLDSSRMNRPAPFADVFDEITRSSPRPVVAGGGGHLVVVTGARKVNNIRYVRVHDPIYGPGDMRYTDLEEAYGPNDNGKWTHTWMRFGVR